MTRLDDPWYDATSSVEQAAVLDGLARVASGQTGAPMGEQLRAVSSLIELCHLSRHPRARVPVLRALGRCADHFVAVPALHAELDSPDGGVVEAALDAIGHVGLAYGGSVVARWLEQVDAESLPRPLLEAALRALARTGHTSVSGRVREAWLGGRVGAEAAHLALAEAVSDELLDEARQHLDDPGVAAAAALHLAALWVPDLEHCLAPLLRGDDPKLALLAEHLLRAPRRDVESHVAVVLSADAPPDRVGRLARGLRAHDEQQVVAAFDVLAGSLDLSDPALQGVVRTALAAGLPGLQDVAVELASQGPPDLLSRALYHVHTPTLVLRSGLSSWVDHPVDNVAKAAVRARLNLFGEGECDAMEALLRSPRALHRLEWVRLQQNAWRDCIDREGRSTLPHRRRQSLSRALRGLARDDADPAV